MKTWMILAAVLVAPNVAQAQALLAGVERGGSMRLKPFDAAILDAGEPRNDLSCNLAPFEPQLNFDFLYQTGYGLSVPLKELAGPADELTIMFRVVSEKRREEPVYFFQKLHVPAIEDNADGNAVIEGEFLVGQGKYHVDWLVRDFEGRVCARFWDIEAKASAKEGSLQETRGEVIQPVRSNPFMEDLPVTRRERDRPWQVKVIVNFAPQSLEGTSLGPKDLNGLVAILRKIGREPRIGSYSMVACSIQTQQVFYRQESAPKIDLPALGEALQSINLAKIHIQQLAKNSETTFLSGLITAEMTQDHPDALIFVSPKYPLDNDVPKQIVERLKGFDRPVFYLNYSLDPLVFPWRDAIGKIVKQLHGLEYTITRPRDLFSAWSDILSRITAARKSPGSKADF